MEELKEANQTSIASLDIKNIETTTEQFNETQKNSQVAQFDEEQKTTQENLEETPSESVEIKNEDANTTNCLALTIQEDHRIVAIKNVFFRSIRMSWKVVVSTITLALIKLFS